MCYKIILITSTNYLDTGKSMVIIRQIALEDATNALFQA